MSSTLGSHNQLCVSLVDGTPAGQRYDMQLKPSDAVSPSSSQVVGQVLDQGDLRAITRYHAGRSSFRASSLHSEIAAGYYDWTVNPSAMVDAPRGCAIRGVSASAR